MNASAHDLRPRGAREPDGALEAPYLDLLADVRRNGVERADRTGVGTRGVFGRQMRFDLRRGFPLLTTKRVHFKSVVAELLWFLEGSTNNNDLRARGCTIWDEWADPETGELGPVYGRQWRSWATPARDGREAGSIDQIARLVEGLRADPYGRRHIVSAWNPADIEDMALPPCHCLFQFHVTPVQGRAGRLSCQLYQRSADIFLGVPFNIASYALLTHMVAQVVGLEVGDFVHTLGDAHLYLNHLAQADLQLSRAPTAAPRLVLAPRSTLEAYGEEDIALEGYAPHPPIRAPVAV